MKRIFVMQFSILILMGIMIGYSKYNGDMSVAYTADECNDILIKCNEGDTDSCTLYEDSCIPSYSDDESSDDTDYEIDDNYVSSADANEYADTDDGYVDEASADENDADKETTTQDESNPKTGIVAGASIGIIMVVSMMILFFSYKRKSVE